MTITSSEFFKFYFKKHFFYSRFKNIFFAFTFTFLGLIFNTNAQENYEYVPQYQSQVPFPSGNINPNNAKQRNVNGNLSVKENVVNTKPTKTLEEKEDSIKIAFRKSIYGYNIFNNSKIDFSPSSKIATPRGYILGPEDQLLIDVNNPYDVHYTLDVSPDGMVKIPIIGSIFVNGLTIEDAKARIINRLSTLYSGLKTGNTSANITLGNIRTIRVTVQGEAITPGTFTVSSFATVMNVLYLAGGPNENGTFREVKLIRRKKVIATLDLYDYLTSGIQRNDLALQDQDIVNIGYYKSRIEIKGLVKKPAVFEVMPNESLLSVINQYAGGFTSNAFLNTLKLVRIGKKDLSYIDIDYEQLSKFIPQSGDQLNVEGISGDRLSNAVILKGAVFRPGSYSVTDNPTLSKLIKRAEGLKEDAFVNRIVIERTLDDLTKQNISVNFSDILNGKAEDLKLKREDIVTVYSSDQLAEKYTVRIQGEVNLVVNESKNSEKITYVNVFPYKKNLTVEDLIAQAGGLKESAAVGRIEVIRRKKNKENDDITNISSTIGEKFNFQIAKDLSLNEQASKFLLEPFDEIFVRSSPNYEKQQFVTINGQVLFEGNYGLERKDERISDIIQRAGGLNKFAYTKGASLVRKSKLTQTEIEIRNKQFSKLKSKDSVLPINELADVSEEAVGINLEKALENPSGKEDLLLQDGDIIIIPKLLQTVKMNGEVLFPTTTSFLGYKSFKNYINESGGFTSNASKSQSFIRYANGQVMGTKKFLFFRRYPTVEPGSEIIVPLKIHKENGAQIAQGYISSAATSLAAIGSIITTYLLIKSSIKN